MHKYDLLLKDIHKLIQELEKNKNGYMVSLEDLKKQETSLKEEKALIKKQLWDLKATISIKTDYKKYVAPFKKNLFHLLLPLFLILLGFNLFILFQGLNFLPVALFADALGLSFTLGMYALMTKNIRKLKKVSNLEEINSLYTEKLGYAKGLEDKLQKNKQAQNLVVLDIEQIMKKITDLEIKVQIIEDEKYLVLEDLIAKPENTEILNQSFDASSRMELIRKIDKGV